MVSSVTPLMPCADRRPALRVLGQRALQQRQEDLELLGLGRRRGPARRRPSRTRCPCGRASWRRRRRRGSCSGRVRRRGQVSACSVHHQYSSSVSPFQAKTGTPCGPRACRRGRRRPRRRRGPGSRRCCTSTQRTSAPSAVSVSISTAVWIVMCSEPDDPRALERLRGGELLAGLTSGRASRARRGGSPCGRTRRGRGRRP